MSSEDKSERSKVRSQKDIFSVLKKDPLSIQFIENPTEEQMIYAVSHAIGAIEHINNPSVNVQIAAVRKHGSVLLSLAKMGINPTRDVLRAAIMANPRNIMYVRDADEELQILAIGESPLCIYDMIIAGLKPCSKAISEAKEPVIRWLLEAVKRCDFKTVVDKIKRLRSGLIDWPELDIIEKSCKIELERERKT